MPRKPSSCKAIEKMSIPMNQSQAWASAMRRLQSARPARCETRQEVAAMGGRGARRPPGRVEVADEMGGVVDEGVDIVGGVDEPADAAGAEHEHPENLGRHRGIPPGQLTEPGYQP